MTNAELIRELEAYIKAQINGTEFSFTFFDTNGGGHTHILSIDTDKILRVDGVPVGKEIQIAGPSVLGGVRIQSGSKITINSLNGDIDVNFTGYATETFVNTAVSTHNSSGTAHNDIRQLI